MIGGDRGIGHTLVSDDQAYIGLRSVGAICIALIGPLAIPLAFGEDFAAAVPTFLAAVPGIWCLRMWRTVTANLTGRGLPGQRSASAVAAAAALIVLDLMFVPQWRITAAGAVSTLA